MQTVLRLVVAFVVSFWALAAEQPAALGPLAAVASANVPGDPLPACWRTKG